jgi:glycosyltransferase involved in cell wall biosynthesis
MTLPVSIVIPVFNLEHYLYRAITSAMNQSLKDIEILVVDDGSRDHSMSIVENLMRVDSRLRIVRHSTNAGTHAARTTCVENARGVFILSLDPDDVLFPFTAEDALHVAVLHYADVVEFQALEVVNGSARLFSFLNPPVMKATGFALAELFSNHQLNWNIWKRLVRRDAYAKALAVLPRGAKMRRIIYAEDKLHFGCILLFARRFYYLKAIGYIYYRDNPDNSESGKQQTRREALRQLRYVERGLKYMYKKIANLSYTRWMEIPTGLADLKMRRRRRRVQR